MSAYLVGLAVLAGSILLLRYLLTAEPRKIVRLVRLASGALLGVLGMMMSLRGLFMLGGPVSLYGFLMVARALGWEGMPGLRLPGLGLPGASSGGSSGPASGVRTRFLDMTLDHYSGAMDGLIREGEFSGRRLSELALEELFSLLRHVRLEDADSARLVETYLDREHPEWRDSGGQADETAGSEGSTASSGPMTEKEALAILELSGSPTPEEVREAYKRQMKRHHPDQGGTDEGAARLNAARDYLLQ